MTKCYWKSVAESESPEGEYVRSVHPEINFSYCSRHCNGYLINDCPNSHAKARKEIINMSGRLELRI